MVTPNSAQRLLPVLSGYSHQCSEITPTSAQRLIPPVLRDYFHQCYSESIPPVLRFYSQQCSGLTPTSAEWLLPTMLRHYFYQCSGLILRSVQGLLPPLLSGFSQQCLEITPSNAQWLLPPMLSSYSHQHSGLLSPSARVLLPTVLRAYSQRCLVEACAQPLSCFSSLSLTLLTLTVALAGMSYGHALILHKGLTRRDRLSESTYTVTEAESETGRLSVLGQPLPRALAKAQASH